MIALLALACNRAPVDYDYRGVAPGAHAAWTHPSNTQCADEPDAPVIDGFSYCHLETAVRKVAILDPKLVPCDQATGVAPPDAAVLAVADGAIARAYPLKQLKDREAVDDDWAGDPVLVDY